MKPTIFFPKLMLKRLIVEKFEVRSPKSEARSPNRGEAEFSEAKSEARNPNRAKRELSKAKSEICS